MIVKLERKASIDHLAIREMAESSGRFLSRNSGKYAHITPMGNSMFSSWLDHDMSDAQIELIVGGLGSERKGWSFIQIQRYLVGEYILPHKDNYGIIKLLNFPLTTSSVDGLTFDRGDATYVKALDVAGQLSEFDSNKFHWVDPIQEKTRYSLVIGF